MRQFCVYRNRNAATRALYPLLLNVQSDLISETGTRVVVPLVPILRGSAPPTISALTPTLSVQEKPHVLLVPLLAAVENADLGALNADLAHARAEILAALDLLISGI